MIQLTNLEVDQILHDLGTNRLEAIIGLCTIITCILLFFALDSWIRDLINHAKSKDHEKDN